MVGETHPSSGVVAVLGCGVIGSSWAEAFAQGGYAVRAWDPDPAARARLADRLGDRVAVFDSPETAVAGADFVQENGPENLETKRDLLSRLAPVLGPDTLVASSTSTLQPSAIQSELPFAARILIGHPFNPPHILPLVEVVGGKDTSDDAIGRAMTIYRALGKHPIHLHTERLGHLANRLQAALWREAVDAVATGQASVADVDAAVTLALGPRWAVMGPFATFQLGGGEGGLAHFLEHLGQPFETLWDDAQRPAMTDALKQELVAATRESVGTRSPGALSADRDARLRAVLQAAQADVAVDADRAATDGGQ